MSENITEEELRKAITEAMVEPEVGFLEGETTAPAAARKHEISIPRMRQILSTLCDQGVVERAKVIFTDEWGDRRRIKGYRLKGV